MADPLKSPRDEPNPGARHATDILEREKYAAQSYQDSQRAEQDQRDAFEKEFGGENYDKTAEKSGSDLLREKEEAAASPINYTGSGNGKKSTLGSRIVVKMAKKRVAAGGIAGLIGVALVALSGVFAPAGMLVNMMDSLTFTNDATSTALEQRFLKVFGGMTAENADPVCANTTKSIKCKMGRISNKALNQLEKKGIRPIGVDDRKRTGYPDRNPTAYEIDMGAGRKVEVQASNLASFLGQTENRKVAAKVLGVGGAFNMQHKAWIGKHITSKFYNPFELKRKGGLADGQNGTKTPQERLTEAEKKLQERIPNNEKLGTVSGGISERVTERMNLAKKGGPAYVAAVGGCVAVKAPSYIAAGVAAVQLAQIMPVVMDVVLAPGSKAKASAFGSGFSAEDMDTIATLLTVTVAGASAMDSQYLQAAMGVNKTKPAVSEAFTPGFSVLSNPAVKASVEAGAASQPACNAIMSPTAMYTAMTADIAITVASSATIVGGIFKVAASFLVQEAAIQVVQAVVGEYAQEVLTDIAENDKIPTAKGKDLGDVLGISAASFFSAGAMARHLPVLKTSQVTAFNEMRNETEARQREMDIASLSPFDVTSRYTFMGSAVNTLRQTALINGGYSNPGAALVGLAKLPFSNLLPQANASQFNDNYCGYADQFGLSSEPGKDAPAVNMAGLPCAGITRTQAGMSSETAVDLLSDANWIDESKMIGETDIIEDLQTSGFIVKESPLDDFITTCSNMITGEYLLDMDGCTVSAAGAGTKGIDSGLDTSEFDGGEGVDPVDSRTLEAMSVFLIDYQIATMVNAEDEESAVASGGTAVATGKYSSPVGANHGMSDGFGPRSCSGCSSWHVGLDLLNSADTNVYSFGDGVVESADITGGNNIVRIKHADGLVSVYFHMFASDILVSTGDTVTSGQIIGKIGNSGDSYGAHLHFELDISGVTDPAVYSGYPKNTAGFAPPGERIDPLPFMRDQGLAGY